MQSTACWAHGEGKSEDVGFLRVQGSPARMLWRQKGTGGRPAAKVPWVTGDCPLPSLQSARPVHECRLGGTAL